MPSPRDPALGAAQLGQRAKVWTHTTPCRSEHLAHVHRLTTLAVPACRDQGHYHRSGNEACSVRCKVVFDFRIGRSPENQSPPMNHIRIIRLKNFHDWLLDRSRASKLEGSFKLGGGNDWPHTVHCSRRRIWVVAGLQK